MLWRGIMTSLFCSSLLLLSAQGQPPGGGGIEEVTYRAADGKIIESTAEVKDSAAGLSLIIGGKVKDVISPASIIKVEPRTLPGLDIAALGLARNLEKSADLGKALAEYTKLIKGIASAPERTRRYVLFKEAMLTSKVADQKSGDEFKDLASKGVVKLAAFARANKRTWEVWPASLTAARTFNELGQYADAAAILEDLASVPDLPKELKAEARIAQVAALIRARQALTTESILAELEKDPAVSSALKDRVAILKICARLDFTPKTGAVAGAKPPESVKQLDVAIATAKDPVARAMGFNFMGDLYTANGMDRDAMWSYLWTDTVYNNDNNEQLYALSKLASLAEKANDEDRANFFRERMIQAR